MTCGIYKITNNTNGKLYIGQSVDIKNRWRNHIYNVGYEYKKNHLYSAIRKYGLDNFLFEVIVECDEHMLDEFEIGIIKLYDTTNPKKGYNRMSGGANGRHSEETKKKLSKSHKGKTFSDKTKKKMSESQKGKTHSEETKKKLSKSQKGKTHSEEIKKKLSKSHKGKTLSEEIKKKISESKKNMTDETKKKMSEAKIKQYLYQGIIYNGLQELADFLGMIYNTLSKRIHRKQIDVTIIEKDVSDD